MGWYLKRKKEEEKKKAACISNAGGLQTLLWHCLKKSPVSLPALNLTCIHWVPAMESVIYIMEDI